MPANWNPEERPHAVSLLDSWLDSMRAPEGYAGPVSHWWDLWPLLWSWILFRRLSLSIETIAYDHIWSKYAWTPVLLLPVDFLIGLVAFATVRCNIITFKGFRPKEG
jgi:hypothetical protein